LPFRLRAVDSGLAIANAFSGWPSMETALAIVTGLLVATFAVFGSKEVVA
jgi:hypothetical protein